MSDRPTPPLQSLEIQSYTVELEPDIVAILRASFGSTWGDGDFWRWKHSGRPGFVPADVAVFMDAGTPVACFHVSLRSLRLLPGLDVPCSIEGDFAIRPELRGAGLPQQAYLHAAPRLADRSIVLRAGFSSPELYNRVYKRKFGHRMIPTVTTQYRKILSDRALRGKLQDLGDKIRSRPSLQRLLKHRAATLRIEVAGFQPCSLTLAHDSSQCTGDLPQRADLTLRLPYSVLAVPRMPPLPGLFTVVRAIFSGQVWASGLFRILVRWSRAQLSPFT
jgi:hypothetical protein